MGEQILYTFFWEGGDSVYMRGQVLAMTSVKMTAFLDIAPCSLTEV
jgi:hypothetical protein